jgi:hypothetical protein
MERFMGGMFFSTVRDYWKGVAFHIANALRRKPKPSLDTFRIAMDDTTARGGSEDTPLVAVCAAAASRAPSISWAAGSDFLVG